MPVPALPLPRNLVEATARDERQERRDWLTALPEIVQALARRWSLRLGAPFQPGGDTAWVAPARTAGGDDLVLKAATREPWLVIDPKPYVGDPTYDPIQHLLNCPERLLADPHGLALRMADLLDLDRERVLLWLFARCVQESPDWPLCADVACKVAPVT